LKKQKEVRDWVASCKTDTKDTEDYTWIGTDLKVFVGVGHLLHVNGIKFILFIFMLIEIEMTT